MDKKFIGLNAGIIWRIISDQQKWKYSELKQKSGLPDKELYAAIGWLAREDKIEIEHGEDGNEDTFYLQFNMYIRIRRDTAGAPQHQRRPQPNYPACSVG